MKQTITFSQFCDGFTGSYQNNFSYEGKQALFDYFENCEEDGQEEIEFDPIALCCEYSEYDSALEAARAYDYEEVVDLEPHGSVDLIEVGELEEAQALEWLRDRTHVIEFGGGVIIQEF